MSGISSFPAERARMWQNGCKGWEETLKVAIILVAFGLFFGWPFPRTTIWERHAATESCNHVTTANTLGGKSAHWLSRCKYLRFHWPLTHSSSTLLSSGHPHISREETLKVAIILVAFGLFFGWPFPRTTIWERHAATESCNHVTTANTLGGKSAHWLSRYIYIMVFIYTSQGYFCPISVWQYHMILYFTSVLYSGFRTPNLRLETTHECSCSRWMFQMYTYTAYYK